MNIVKIFTVGLLTLCSGCSVDSCLVRDKNCHDTSVVDSYSFENKVLGSLLAAATGDALGRVTEFLSLDQIKAKYGKPLTDFSDFKENDFYTIKSKKTAVYTDDTAMALLVFKALLTSREKGLDLDATMSLIATGLMKDVHNKFGWTAPFRAPGNGCLNAMQVLEKRVGTQIDHPRWWDINAISAGGCGSVMRAYPFGLVFYDDPEKAITWAAEHSKITHGAPIAIAASAALAAGVASAVQNTTCDEIVQAMISAARRYDEKTASMIAEAAQLAKNKNVSSADVFTKFQGWAAHDAIAAATYIFVLSPDNVEYGLSLGVNTPGDSDSIASIAGALIGARCGADALKHKNDWQAILEDGYMFSELAHTTAQVVTSLE